MKYHRWGDFLTKGVKQTVSKWNRFSRGGCRWKWKGNPVCLQHGERCFAFFSTSNTHTSRLWALTEETFFKFWKHLTHKKDSYRILSILTLWLNYGTLCAVLSNLQYIINLDHAIVLILFRSKASGFFPPKQNKANGIRWGRETGISQHVITEDFVKNKLHKFC